jgi:hypothetical protein
VTAHVKAPDLDKLARSVFDALTRVVFHDDAQVVDLVATKRYATVGEPPRVEPRGASGRGGAVATGSPALQPGRRAGRDVWELTTRPFRESYSDEQPWHMMCGLSPVLTPHPTERHPAPFTVLPSTRIPVGPAQNK